jgi:hypothetical protein
LSRLVVHPSWGLGTRDAIQVAKHADSGVCAGFAESFDHLFSWFFVIPRCEATNQTYG